MASPDVFVPGTASLFTHSPHYPSDFKDSFVDRDLPEIRYCVHQKSPLPFYNPERRPSFLRFPQGRWITPLLCCLAILSFFALGRHSTSQSVPFSPQGMPEVGVLSGARDTFVYTNGSAFVRPVGMKIVGTIFFGRRQFVDIMDCYLRRNLAINGGMLDEVQFLLHTDKQEDIDWIRKLIREDGLNGQYKLMEEDTTREGWSQWRSYPPLYKNFMSDPDTLYIKMDDDLVYIDDYAIPELVRVSMEHPEAHSVQGNNINNRWSYWFHYRLNAIYPYLAERDPSQQWPASTWRPSELPRFHDAIPGRDTNFTATYKPPFDDHRWLPLDSSAANLQHTPYGPFQPPPTEQTTDTAVSWAFVAQSHMSFFENLERGELGRYDFGNSFDHTWNLWYSRWNINLMAIRGSYIARTPFWTGKYAKIEKGDEYLLTEVVSRDLDMPVLVATRAMAAHYSFRGDRKRLLKTDILDRYRAYANEMVCAPGNQKRGFGKRRPHNLVGDGNGGSGEGEEIGDGPADKFNMEGAIGIVEEEQEWHDTD